MARTGLLSYPEQAKDYVAQTEVDALAIGTGTSHGAYKFTRWPTGHSRHRSHCRNPRDGSQFALRDAWLVPRPAGMIRDHS